MLVIMSNPKIAHLPPEEVDRLPVIDRLPVLCAIHACGQGRRMGSGSHRGEPLTKKVKRSPVLLEVLGE